MTDAEIDALLTERGYRVQRKGSSISVDGRPYTVTQLANLAEMEAGKPQRPFRLGDGQRSPIDRLFPQHRKGPQKPVFLAHQEPISQPALPVPPAAPKPATAAPEPLSGQAVEQVAPEPPNQPELTHVVLATPPAAVALAQQGLGLCQCGRPLDHARACRYSKGGRKVTPVCTACGEPCGKYSRRCNKCVANKIYAKGTAEVIKSMPSVIQLTFEQRIVALEEKVEKLLNKPSIF